MSDALRWLPAYIGLGANLGDPPATLREAARAIDALEQVRLVASSSLYRSAPLGPAGQPDYCNAAVAVLTTLTAAGLLQALLAIENQFGRVRGAERWGPRTLDLDILVYADRSIDEPDLVVPHPGLGQRNFVLYPLAEIAPGLRIPGLGSLAALLARTDTTGLEKME